ncbi:MAG: DUF2637 domain-containing protein [Microbacterium sp.]|uniref:DUF2637 domain-containing protein n=1 Tax=Microbacterium sp. TaxID=51671 RepID=UPI001AC2E045|nr:DUF2637 domain-containing protein [Microbacterium sp.]MBN9214116.1 DUF2637 domain-containing protein [Microbacterium sp.]
MSGEKRTAQISPDRLAVGFFAISLVVIVMSSSMVFSYVGIAEAAAWTGVPFGIHVIAPVFIDGAIITYTVSLTIFEWRREDPHTIRHTKRVLRGFTLLSVVLNFAHTASYWEWDFTVYEAWFGTLISVAAPIAALLSAEEVVRLAFRRRGAVDEPVAAPETAVPEPAVVPLEMPAAEETAPVERTVPLVVPPAPPQPEPAAAEEESVVAEAERLIYGAEPAADDDEQPEDDGIIRFPAEGEVLIRAIDRATDIDRAF